MKEYLKWTEKGLLKICGGGRITDPCHVFSRKHTFPKMHFQHRKTPFPKSILTMATFYCPRTLVANFNLEQSFSKRRKMGTNTSFHRISAHFGFLFFASHFEKYWNAFGSSGSQRLRSGFRHLALPEQITGKPRSVGAANKMEGKPAGRGLAMMTDSCG